MSLIELPDQGGWYQEESVVQIGQTDCPKEESIGIFF